MIILMILESNFPPDTRVENEAFSLVKAGHKVHIACFRKKDQKHYEESDGIRIHRFSIGKFRHKSSVAALRIPWYFNFWKKRLSSLIEKEKFDAIHIHDLPLASTGHYLKQRYGIKFILDLHENWPELLNISPHTKTLPGRILCNINQWKRYEKRYVPLADKIIVVVDEAKNRVSEFCDQDKISVVSNTINLNKLEIAPDQKKSNDKTVIIYEGGITYHRGIQILLKSLRETGEALNYIELWIVGDGSYLPVLKEITSDLGLERYVRFWGWQNQQEVFKLLAQADIAIIPHLKSGHTDSTIPHKLFHYLYAGIPVIASDCRPVERIINETESGFIYPSQNSKRLSELILTVINLIDNGKHNLKGKEFILKKYNWAYDENILHQIYDS